MTDVEKLHRINYRDRFLICITLGVSLHILFFCLIVDLGILNYYTHLKKYYDLDGYVTPKCLPYIIVCL